MVGKNSLILRKLFFLPSQNETLSIIGEEGAVLSVSTVTYPTEKHAAKVSGINPVIDDNGMIHIEATLEPHPHLLPGMTAFVTIEFR